ncbi:membrane protein [Synergistales bacterium]|nr:membrane protein [Synergistales bacterium]
MEHNMKSERTRTIAVFALFAAIIFIMTFTPLGFIPLGFMNATIVHVPVIIGSLLLGPKMGALLGFMFGLGSFIRAVISPTVMSFCFTPLMPVPGTDSGSLWALAVCFIPRILTGVVPYYVNRMLAGNGSGHVRRYIASFSAGIAGSLTNTLLVMNLIYMIFGPQYAEAIGKAAEWIYGLILTVIIAHGVPEAITAGLLSSIIAMKAETVIRKR